MTLLSTAAGITAFSITAGVTIVASAALALFIGFMLFLAFIPEVSSRGDTASSQSGVDSSANKAD